MQVDRHSEPSVAPEPDRTELGCGVCHKRYARQCDLNKHYKTHSRPFKCPVPDCKFQERGWPTEKELLRHQNDKHSMSPRVFRCTFQPCDYTSKRESNCKQHMEKNHGWEYIRSRPPRPNANTSERPEPQQDGLLYVQPAEGSAVEPTNTPALPWGLSSRTSALVSDFLGPAFSLDNQISGPEHAVDTLSDVQEPMQGSENMDPAEKESDVFLVWESPPTKLKKMETVLSRLPPSLFAATAAPWSSSLDNAPTDAGLLSSPPIKSAPSPTSDVFPMTALPGLYQTDACGGYDDCSSAGQACHGKHATDNQPRHNSDNNKRHSDNHGPDGEVFPTGSHEGPNETHNATGTLESRQDDADADADSDVDADADAYGDDDDDEDGDDAPPPRKKARVFPDNNFNDSDMECPFRLRNPDFYKIEKDSRYSPCYTPHSQISTIVRHIKRPAHRLRVERTYISSFEVAYDTEIRHPAAGLCRKCWRAYKDRSEFDRHVSARSCSRVSRSKREKFWLLHDTFCVPLPDESQSTVAAGVVPPASNRKLQPVMASLNQDGQNALPDAPAIPTAAQPNTASAAVGQSDAPQSYMKRLEALEQTTSQLLEMVTSIMRRDNVQAGNGRPKHAGPETWSAERVSEPMRQDSGVSDKESLVGGMNSQSTDVDRDGLFLEVKSALSSVSSDTDRSTIRHVPHAESQELHSAKTEEPGRVSESIGAGNSHSVTDSGFVSDGHGGGGGLRASSARVPGDETAESLPCPYDAHGSQAHTSLGQSWENGAFFTDAMAVYGEVHDEPRESQWPDSN